MKRNIFNLLKLLLLFVILLLMIAYSNELISIVIKSIAIWKNNIFTTLFPFFIISDLLIQYGFIDIIGELTKNITKRFFSLTGESSFVIISSILTGFPSSSKYIKSLLEEKTINTEEAQYLLSFTHFPNPIFITGIVGNLLSKEISILILISIYLGNLVLALLFRRKKKLKKERINLSKSFQLINQKNNKNNLIKVLSNSIYKAIDVLVLILGIITIFFILSLLINKVFSFNETINSIISGLLEITQGIKKVALLNIPIHFKATIITSFISFGGLSIHIQTKSILDNPDISYRDYFAKRILHSIISGVIIYSLCILNA